jgi:prepilin-type N-terminal cleavage/methylation domain-containing protein
MEKIMQFNHRFSIIRKQAAFTMIELLIVIAILGILAVAVLAAINPIEQINRGRDTGSRSDSEQLLSAIDRYYAYKGYYPWVTNPNIAATLEWRGVAGDTAINVGEGTITAWDDGSATPCYVLDKLANGNAAETCAGNNEVKRSFVDKITKSDFNHLYVYYNGDPGSSLYVCFLPQSGAFKEEAAERCVDTAGSGLPADLRDAAGSICAAGAEYVCLP